MAHLQFNCDSCRQDIASFNPRVHCLVCPNYDLCANCMLGERFTQGHIGGHNTQVFKQSGGTGQHPIPASNYPTPAPAAPQHPPYHDQASRAAVPAPPVPPSQSYTPQNFPSTTTAGNGAPGWQPWFNPDSSPTPAFVTLMNDIFTHLDPTNVGNLVPETFSAFMDEMGYLPNENAWKSNLQSSYNGLSKESNADAALKNSYDLFSIDHVLLQRRQAPEASSSNRTSTFSRLLGSALKVPSAAAGPMPAITRNGFVEIARVTALADPSREWGNFSRLLKKWNLPRYRGWGDLPRSVLPPVPDAGILARIGGAKAQTQQQLDDHLAALQMAVDINRRGNEIAVSAISGDKYVYERRYF